jgi:hypothetical protein
VQIDEPGHDHPAGVDALKERGRRSRTSAMLPPVTTTKASSNASSGLSTHPRKAKGSSGSARLAFAGLPLRLPIIDRRGSHGPRRVRPLERVQPARRGGEFGHGFPCHVERLAAVTSPGKRGWPTIGRAGRYRRCACSMGRRRRTFDVAAENPEGLAEAITRLKAVELLDGACTGETGRRRPQRASRPDCGGTTRRAAPGGPSIVVVAGSLVPASCGSRGTTAFCPQSLADLSHRLARPVRTRAPELRVSGASLIEW